MTRHSKKTLSPIPVTAVIESLTHDGRGVTHVDGKVVFIDQALMGEEVEFIYTENKKDYAEGVVVRVITPSAQRVEPNCPHYVVCGGCSFQHVSSQEQIHIKQDLLVEQFKRIGKVDCLDLWQPLESEPWGYRRKARMGVKYVAKKNRMLIGFRERRRSYLAEMDNCLVMHPLVGKQLIALGNMIEQLTIRDQIPQIEVAIGENTCILAVRVLQLPTADDIEKMRLFAHQHGVHLYLQPKGVDSMMPLPNEPAITLTYSLPEHGIEFKFRPAMFTQVNYEMNRLMINRVLEILDLTDNDTVLDLFCGLGNFTLPMAKKAKLVVGVEGDVPLTKHAKENALYNQITNVEFHTADLSKPLTDNWANQCYDKILLDPSRAGASEVLPYLTTWQAKRIVYVSCNPSTLARDAGILVNELGYKLVKAGVMDMFPQTAHVESIALFEK